MQITHQVMWDIMMASHKHFGMFSEEDVNEMCRELQEGRNRGVQISPDAVFAKALQRMRIPAKRKLEAPSVNFTEDSVHSKRQADQMRSSHAELQHAKDSCKGVMQGPAASSERNVENASDLLNARLLAIRRAHEEADDGNTRTRF
jgi:hypothetical protein